MSALVDPTIPVSWGELLDKLTILEIKRARIRDRDACAHVAAEHRLLAAIAAPALALAGVDTAIVALRAINAALWDIEDAIRREEARGVFGAEFVALARAVYIRNDARAAIKRDLNLLLGSALIEQKSYWCVGEDARQAQAPLRLPPAPARAIVPHEPGAIDA